MATRGVRGMVRSATPARRHDLWPRLRARLAEDEEQVCVEVPPFGWGWGVAVAAAIGLLAAVPEPVRFLTAAGLL